MKKNSRNEKASERSRGQARLTVGVDVGDKRSWFCILDEEGEIVVKGSLPTTPNGFKKQFELLGPSRIALEVGAHSRWISEQLKRYGHEVIVANARQLPLIYASDRKRDPVDAEKLARVARLDPKMLCPIEHRSVKAQRDLAIPSRAGSAGGDEDQADQCGQRTGEERRSENSGVQPGEVSGQSQ